MITLAPAPFVTNPLTKCGSYSDQRSAGGPNGLLARMVGFKRNGASMHAHRYNGQADGTNMAPPAGGGQMPRDLTVPATAIYVVWSYNTPIAWVDEDGTVTVPDTYYSVTTTMHQGKCRAWLGAAVQGTTAHARHIEAGYRTA